MGMENGAIAMSLERFFELDSGVQFVEFKPGSTRLGARPNDVRT
jgi:hypothetical protein